MNYQFGGCSLDTRSLELKRNGDLVALEPQVFRLIVCLIENRDRVVSKDNLIEIVWKGRIISDSSLNTCINSARKAVGDDGKTQAVIKTFPRRGFRFVADIVETQSGLLPAEPEALPAPEKPSIAVLPFNNLSDNSQQEYFSVGLAQDITTALSKIDQMRVIARNSPVSTKGQMLDLRRIAEELGVRYVLEGSVRRGGDRLRITAELIDASDGSHLWAERYDRPVDDLFDVQDEITKEIVTSLRVKLTDGESAHVWSRGTNNIEAWEYGVRAMELFRDWSPSGYREARTLAEKAIELDPDFALAWAILGFTYWFDGRLGYTGDSDAKLASADKYAERAMTLDDSLSWCVGLKAFVAAATGCHDEGVTIAQRGVGLNPSNADMRAMYAFALLYAGSYREAEEQFRAAMLLNPFYPIWYLNGLARTLTFLKEFEEALHLGDCVLEIAPAHLQAWLHRAYIYGEIGREEDACNAMLEIRRLHPDLRVRHLPGMILVNDAGISKRFIAGLRKAGLPE